MPGMSDEYYASLEERLRGLIPLVEGVVPVDRAEWYVEYLDVGEYGLAVEIIAEVLGASGQSARQLATGLLREAELMALQEPYLQMLRQAAGASA